MCRNTTSSLPGSLLALFLMAGLAVGPSLAQPGPASVLSVRPDWRRIGNTALDYSLASLATGPVERVWFSAEGSRLFARTPSGRVLETADFESWRELGPSAPSPPPLPDRNAGRLPSLPEPGARIATGRNMAPIYALGRAVYRSDDDGLSWSNLTEYHRHSILGEGLSDLAVSTRNEDELVVASRHGLWRSLDGGLSWTGLNHSLPNLPVRRLLRLPSGSGGTRLLLAGLGEVEWAPGEKLGWRPVADSLFQAELVLRQALSASLQAEISAIAVAGDYLYAGGTDGRLWTSYDRGRSWRSFTLPGAGAVEALFADSAEPRLAVAALGPSRTEGPAPHVLRTTNGGLFWDDLTADLPAAAAHGIAANLATGAVYVATDAGVFFTVADLLNPAPATSWRILSSDLPEARATDVKLDSAGNQLFVALDGYGVFAAMAPHRYLDPRVVNAADWSARPAAPGLLLSVLGRKVHTARAGSRDLPVLAASDAESQIQVPFEVSGSSLLLALGAASHSGQSIPHMVGLPLQGVAPAVFVDPDGTPMLLDADSGVLLDGMNPARSNSRLQILAAGLGRVQPDWPTGLPAPLDAPPRVVAPVRVFLDRVPLEVTRATLAPGYVGFYLIEARIPEIVNSGPAELYIEADGHSSNRVRLYLQP